MSPVKRLLIRMDLPTHTNPARPGTPNKSLPMIKGSLAPLQCPPGHLRRADVLSLYPLAIGRSRAFLEKKRKG